MSSELVLMDGSTPLLTYVYPVDPTYHHDYTFYIKTTMSGNLSETFYGPWILSVGCTQYSVSMQDNPDLVITHSVYIGTPVEGQYLFRDPYSIRQWCVPETFDKVYNILEADDKLLGSGPNFDVYSTDSLDIFSFKIETVYNETDPVNVIRHTS